MFTTHLFAPTNTISCTTAKADSFETVKDFAEAAEKKILQMEQVHGSHFVFLEQPPETAEPIANADGVLTTAKNLLLTVRTADCLPILLFHPAGVVGALHAGRKSTQQQLLARVLQFLKTKYDTTDQISLWFGPAICESCYQIDRATDTHYSLLAENMQQAYSVFPAEAIHLTVQADCTRCLADEYHSYRVEGPGLQMNYSAVGLL